MDYPNIQPIIPISNSDTDSSELSDMSVSLLPDPIANIVDNHCTNCGQLLDGGEAAIEYCPNCCCKIVQLNANSVYDAFKLWDTEATRSTSVALCEYSRSEGGPGWYTELFECTSGLHPNVGYCKDSCPKDCPHFKLKSYEDRFRMFICNYSKYPTYFNEKYNIDRQDKAFIRGYKPDPYSFNL